MLNRVKSLKMSSYTRNGFKCIHRIFQFLRDPRKNDLKKCFQEKLNLTVPVFDGFGPLGDLEDITGCNWLEMKFS